MLLSGGYVPFGHRGLCQTCVPNMPGPAERLDRLQEWLEVRRGLLRCTTRPSACCACTCFRPYARRPPREPARPPGRPVPRAGAALGIAAAIPGIRLLPLQAHLHHKVMVIQQLSRAQHAQQAQHGSETMRCAPRLCSPLLCTLPRSSASLRPPHYRPSWCLSFDSPSPPFIPRLFCPGPPGCPMPLAAKSVPRAPVISAARLAFCARRVVGFDFHSCELLLSLLRADPAQRPSAAQVRRGRVFGSPILCVVAHGCGKTPERIAASAADHLPRHACGALQGCPGFETTTCKA